MQISKINSYIKFIYLPAKKNFNSREHKDIRRGPQRAISKRFNSAALCVFFAYSALKNENMN
jgi:hypothetical protein